MTYNIAGLIVEISGNCKLNQSKVTYVKHPESGVYVRESSLNNMSKNTSERESISLSECSDFIEETEIIPDANSNTLTALMQGCEANQDGESIYVSERLSQYKEGTTQKALVPDFHIQYKVLPKIDKPEGKFLGYMRGLGFYMDQGGNLYLEKRIDLIDDILTKISIDSEFKSAKVELIDVESLGGLPLKDRVHSYIGEAFACLALTKGRIVFHSSAISYKNEGVCFSAPSGTGKSTHSGLWMKYYGQDTEIINDDTPVIYLKDGKPMLCGTPWSGKTALNINKEVPLKGIVFLTRSKENYIERIKGLNALKEFFGEAKVYQITRMFNCVTEIASDILTVTPVWRLGCNISKDAVDLVKTTLGF